MTKPTSLPTSTTIPGIDAHVVPENISYDNKNAAESPPRPPENAPAITAPVVGGTEPGASAPVVEEKALPDWSLCYPGRRGVLEELGGADPLSFPRAHEKNLRLAEFGLALDKASNELRRIPLRDALHKLLYSGKQCVEDDVAPYTTDARTVDERINGFANPAPYPEARASDQIEVPADWLAQYPESHRDLLREHGVPTLAGTRTHVFNMKLIELLPPDCVNKVRIEIAAAKALIWAFGFDRWYEIDVDDYDEWPPMPLSEWQELTERCLERYPEAHRPMLRELGRPDYEHPDAPAFNDALIASRLFLSDVDDRVAHLAILRDHLWRAFFRQDPPARPPMDPDDMA